MTLNLSGRRVQTLTFFGHAQFEVKNFSEFFLLQSALDSEFFAVVVWVPTFCGNTKFEVKIFSEFFHLRLTVNFLQQESGHQFFLVTLNLRSKIFQIVSFTECCGLQICLERRIWAPTVCGHTKFVVKNFSEFFLLLTTVDSEFLRGGRSWH